MGGKFRFTDIVVVLFCISGVTLFINLFRLDLFKTLGNKDEKPIGILVVKHNIVQRRTADRVLWDRPMAESPVYNGDLIHTADLSAATLYIENSSIDLDENTIIRIQRSADDGDVIQIELNGGTLYIATGSGDENFVLNLAGFQVETGPDTVLNASAGSDGIVLKVSEGFAVFSNDDEKRVITSGTMLALDSKGAEITNPAVIVIHFRINAYYLKNGPEPHKINFTWDRVNMEAGEPLRLEIASDRNFVRIVRALENLDTSAEVALNAGLWYWRIIRKDEVLHSGHFTITEATGPQLLSPAMDTLFHFPNQMSRTRFQWTEIEGALSYILEVSETADFINPRLRKETASAFFVDSTLGPGTWYWRVMSVFPSIYEGSSAFSPAFFFRIVYERIDDVVQEQRPITGRPVPELPVQIVGANRPDSTINEQQPVSASPPVQQQMSSSPQPEQAQVPSSPPVQQQPAAVNPVVNIPNPGVRVPTLAERLAWVLTHANEGDEHVIEVTANEIIGPQNLSINDKKVSITIKGNTTGYNIELNTNGSMFRINNGATLILENITLNGRYNNNAPLIEIMSGGTLIISDRAIITGNSNNGRNEGGGIRIDRHGSLTMRGGIISNNFSVNGGGGGVRLSDGGSFSMSGGTISGNSSRDGGGGVSAWNGTFTMNGGTISNNTCDLGGGVQVGGQHGIFIMNNGIVSGNTAKDGGGVYVSNAGNFTMRGGTVFGNTSVNVNGGGGVHIWEGIFSKTGGIIYGYSARDVNSNRASNGDAHAIRVGRENYSRYRGSTTTDMIISFDYTKNPPIGGRGWLE
jgi:hypothetical protein